MKRNGDSGGEGKGRSLLCGLARLIWDVHPCIGGEASHDGGALRRVELPPSHPVIERVERCHVLSVQLERARREREEGLGERRISRCGRAECRRQEGGCRVRVVGGGVPA